MTGSLRQSVVEATQGKDRIQDGTNNLNFTQNNPKMLIFNFRTEVCNGCEFSGLGKALACTRGCNSCNGCEYGSHGRVETCNGCEIYGEAHIDECNGCSLNEKKGLARIDVCNGCYVDRNAGPVWIKLCKQCHMSSCNGCIK